eukprot:11741308-Prorocentrum_lima.AAC.1
MIDVPLSKLRFSKILVTNNGILVHHELILVTKKGRDGFLLRLVRLRTYPDEVRHSIHHHKNCTALTINR